QTTTLLVPLWALFRGGRQDDPDSWPQLRLMAETSGKAVDAALSAEPFGCERQLQRNRRIVECVLALADERGAAASDEARAQADRWRGRLTFRPAESPRPKHPAGGPLPWGDRSRELGHEVKSRQRDT